MLTSLKEEAFKKGAQIPNAADLAAKTQLTIERSSETTASPRAHLPNKPKDNIEVLAGERLVVRWGQERASRWVGSQGHLVPGWWTPEACYSSTDEPVKGGVGIWLRVRELAEFSGAVLVSISPAPSPLDLEGNFARISCRK